MKILDQSGERWSPSEIDIANFDRDGWFVSPKILPDNVLEIAWLAMRKFLDEGESTIDPAARLTDLQRRRADPIDHVGYMSLELEAVRALVHHPAIAETAAVLTGALGMRLFHDRLLVKPPDGNPEGTVGWHVDRAYWYACTSDRMITAWIPFDDITETMGPLMVVPGSHRWDLVPLIATAHRTDMARLWESAAQGRDVQAVPLVMKRGQISFHHCCTLHGSLPNRSDRARPALAVHLQPSDNRHRKVILPNGRMLAHTNDLLCRRDEAGAPDYCDPDVFPLLWGNGL